MDTRKRILDTHNQEYRIENGQLLWTDYYTYRGALGRVQTGVEWRNVTRWPVSELLHWLGY